jgi:hypothetical protein
MMRMSFEKYLNWLFGLRVERDEQRLEKFSGGVGQLVPHEATEGTHLVVAGDRISLESKNYSETKIKAII